jgi:hypothetical protein
MINDVLPHNVFIEIFDLYRMDEVLSTSPLKLPWKWHTLAHVCRAWRDIIFSSSHRLNLELLCTYGTPVRKNIGFLPAFPIVIELPAYAKESDEDNIIAALEHPDRIRVVSVHVTCSLLKKMITVMQQPFPVLTDLFLEWEILEDKPTPVLPGTFLGGCAPHLQTIRLNRIPFPAAPTLLSSARELVDIDFRDIPDTGYILPEEIVASLATLPRLECLIFQYQFGTSYSDPIRLPPLTRTVLPSLTTIWFQGPFEYFEYFVAQVDAPQLKCLEITYSDRDEDEGVDFQIPQLSKFIDHSETLSRFKYAELDTWPDSVDAELLDGNKSVSLRLCIQDIWISQALSQISGMLSNMDHLYITSHYFEYEQLSGNIQWLELLHPFNAVKALSVQYKLSPHIALALNSVTEDWAAEILPALEWLYLEHQAATSVEKFLAIRQSVTFFHCERDFRERLESNVIE